MGRQVEFEQYIPASPFGRRINIDTGRVSSDAHWRKVHRFTGEQAESGQWTLTRYDRRTDGTITEDGFADLGELLDRVASVLEADPRNVRVFKEEDV